MKKLFTLIASAAVTLGMAQTSMQLTNLDNGNNVPSGSVIYVGAAPGATVISNVDVKNTSGTTRTYKVVRNVNYENTGAGTNFCFGGTCFPPQTYSATVTLGPGQTAQGSGGGSLQPYFWDGPSSGQSEVKYVFTNTADHSDTSSVVFRYNNPLSVANNDDMFNSIGDVFPNPAKDKASIQVSAMSEQEISMSVYNSLGSVVSSKKVTLSVGKNSLSVNTESLPSGIYFVSLVNGRTKVIKKMVVN